MGGGHVRSRLLNFCFRKPGTGRFRGFLFLRRVRKRLHGLVLLRLNRWLRGGLRSGLGDGGLRMGNGLFRRRRGLGAGQQKDRDKQTYQRRCRGRDNDFRAYMKRGLMPGDLDDAAGVGGKGFQNELR